jgi:NADH dehydrogenase (ubiquinone) Fe-S protein 6
MLSNARSRAALLLTRRAQVSMRRSYAFSANDKQEIKSPNPSKDVPNVSKTNEPPIETPHRNVPLQEHAEGAEKFGVSQAPNRKDTWSRSQNPRALAMTGPRFEQTIMEYQVCGIDISMGITVSLLVMWRAIQFENLRNGRNSAN